MNLRGRTENPHREFEHMTEKQAEVVAAALGGETWQSGGDIWLVVFRRADGSVVVLTDEVVNEYAGEAELEANDPRSTIVLH